MTGSTNQTDEQVAMAAAVSLTQEWQGNEADGVGHTVSILRQNPGGQTLIYKRVSRSQEAVPGGAGLRAFFPAEGCRFLGGSWCSGAKKEHGPSSGLVGQGHS